ncbi:MAG: hypothetical protein V5A62_17930 [Haloarculaceae archaeon]
MATGGGSGELFAAIREANHDNARLGWTLLLFGVLSVAVGTGLFVVTEVVRFDTETLRTYRKFAGGLVGYGLPMFFYGITVAADGDRVTRTSDVGVLGVLLGALAVVGFLATYPERWHAAGSTSYVIVTLGVYALGTMLCVAAAGGAVFADRDGTDEPEHQRLGRTLVLFGMLSVVGGSGLFVLTEGVRLDAGTLGTYRKFAGGLVGYGLPPLLYGITVARESDTRASDVGVLGLFLATLATVALSATYPERWNAVESTGYLVATLGVYALGTMLCAAAAGGAVFAGRDPTEDADEETGFVWGEPPDDRQEVPPPGDEGR